MRITVSEASSLRNQNSQRSKEYKYIVEHFDECLNAFSAECQKQCKLNASKGSGKMNVTHKSKAVSENKIAIKTVMFNPPATVVFWTDGTKTVVRDEEMNDISKYVKYSFSEDLHHVVKLEEGEIGNVYETKVKPAKKWKEDGLTAAIVKKLVPQYFEILEKWC